MSLTTLSREAPLTPIPSPCWSLSNEWLFQEGDFGSELMVVVDGTVRQVFAGQSAASASTSVLAQSGQSLGEETLHVDEVRGYGVQATERSTVAILPKAEFRRVLQQRAVRLHVGQLVLMLCVGHFAPLLVACIQRQNRIARLTRGRLDELAALKATASRTLHQLVEVDLSPMESLTVDANDRRLHEMEVQGVAATAADERRLSDRFAQAAARLAIRRDVSAESLVMKAIPAGILAALVPVAQRLEVTVRSRGEILEAPQAPQGNKKRDLMIILCGEAVVQRYDQVRLPKSRRRSTHSLTHPLALSSRRGHCSNTTPGTQSPLSVGGRASEIAGARRRGGAPLVTTAQRLQRRCRSLLGPLSLASCAHGPCWKSCPEVRPAGAGAGSG